MTHRPRINFVYIRARQDLGSTFMRAHQLHDITRRYLGDRIDSRLVTMPEGNGLGQQTLWARTRAKGEIWFLTKRCVQSIAPQTAQVLRRSGAGLCFDHVDTPLDTMMRDGADLHIACSVAQQRAFQALHDAGQLTGDPCLVLHNVDLAVEGKVARPADHLRACYLGDPRNTDIPPALLGQIDQFSSKTRAEFLGVIDRMTDYTLHYAVRTQSPRKAAMIKPFLKGFTAAALGANILTERATPDAEHFLGADYPYLADSHDEAHLVDLFNRARDGFGGPEWHQAQDRMRALAARTSPRATADALADMVTRLGGLRRA